MLFLLITIPKMFFKHIKTAAKDLYNGFTFINLYV